jgi:hypothetical protein
MWSRIFRPDQFDAAGGRQCPVGVDFALEPVAEALRAGAAIWRCRGRCGW